MIGVDMVTVVTWLVNSGQISIEVLIEYLQQVVPPHNTHTHTQCTERLRTHTCTLYMYCMSIFLDR